MWAVRLLQPSNTKNYRKKFDVMKKYTQKELRSLVEQGLAQDITSGTNETRQQIEAIEGWLTQIGYASGVYGCNGLLFVGRNTGKLYAVTRRTNAIYIFH
jgi:hypothetical protein